jgi:hypothetical protein
LYEEKFNELEQVCQSVGPIHCPHITNPLPDSAKTSTHLAYANYIIYLKTIKEENIMKKALLDICYREMTKNEAGNLQDFPEGDALI